jgi:hypothetical protein
MDLEQEHPNKPQNYRTALSVPTPVRFDSCRGSRETIFRRRATKVLRLCREHGRYKTLCERARKSEHCSVLSNGSMQSLIRQHSPKAAIRGVVGYEDAAFLHPPSQLETSEDGKWLNIQSNFSPRARRQRAAQRQLSWLKIKPAKSQQLCRASLLLARIQLSGHSLATQETVLLELSSRMLPWLRTRVRPLLGHHLRLLAWMQVGSQLRSSQEPHTT